MQIDRSNEVYMRELRYRTEGLMDSVVEHHMKNGGKFEAKQATLLLMSCMEYARLTTDMLAANGLLPEPEKKEEVTDEVSDLG